MSRSEVRIKRRQLRQRMLGAIPKVVKEIDVESIYYPSRKWHDPYVKYWRQDNGPILKFVNCPWTVFVSDYIRLGNKILDNLDEHVFIKWERDIFLTAGRSTDKVERKKEN